MIDLHDVSKVYQIGEERVHALDHVTLHIFPKEFVSVIGPSGSGKSTLLQLLMGHHRGYEGSISIDGTELRDISPASLYELLSVIQQEVFIFNSSIEKNVTMFGDFAPELIEARGFLYSMLTLSAAAEDK